MDARGKILETALELFARKGFFNTSIREITNKSGTNIASVNYYFGSKINLAISLIETIILPINQIRMEQLEDYIKNTESVTTYGIVRIFIEPVISAVAENEKGILAHQFLNRIIVSGEDEIRNFFHSLMMPVFNKFLDALSICNKNLSRDDLVERLFFSIGAMHHCIILISGIYFGPDFFNIKSKKEKVIEDLISFVVKGMEK